MAENRKENVEALLAEFVHVAPLDRDDGPYGFELIPPGGVSQGFLRGAYATQQQAMDAGIQAIRREIPRLVRAADQEAVRGEQYRAKQRGASQ